MLPTNFAAARDGNLRAPSRSGSRNLAGSARGWMLHFRPMTRRSGWPSAGTQRTGPDLRHIYGPGPRRADRRQHETAYARRVGMPTVRSPSHGRTMVEGPHPEVRNTEGD